MKLDENQRKAVEHFEGPALVVAGPGSGKTTVIKERILNLVYKHNVDPENILAIAFTNAAADEMENRLSDVLVLNQAKPKICTLHAFGKEVLTENYELAGFAQAPDNVWGSEEIEEIIENEKENFKRKTDNGIVVIYKAKGRETGRCYIGQTIDLNRREQEHRTHSSNRGLRQALQEEQFDFEKIETVPGREANNQEKYWIDYYKNRSVVNLNQGFELVGSGNLPVAIAEWLATLLTSQQRFEYQSPDIPVTVYKIQSPSAAICYIGYTTESGPLRKVIKDGKIGKFAFEVIAQLPYTHASYRIEQESKKHKAWAVFNRQDPLHARESTRRRIEVFSAYFNISYEELLKHTQKFKHEMQEFNRMRENIEIAKQQVTTGLFNPDEIKDPIFRAFAKRYEDEKKKDNGLDFLDMLIYSANTLEENSDFLREYKEKYRYVFVDEFQDISPLDFRLIDLFSENLFAVGDDDQAIYGFRGGDSSIMQEQFGKRENVTHYEITRNYRSTSTIVRHAKALIECNPERIDKNLRAKNSTESQVEVFNTPRKSAKVGEVLLKEVLTTDSKEIGVLARNWKGEINNIQEILDFSELQEQGFEVRREKLGERDDEKNRTKIVLRHSNKEVEILNIHTAKGREWEKVILLVNTIYKSLPRNGNDLTEERRLFYVAVTRAKQELVILDGGSCGFVPEFQNVPPIETTETQQEIITTPERQTQIHTTTDITRPQHVPEPAALRRNTNEMVVAINQNIRIPDQLDQIVEKYLDRLIFGFGSKYQLTNINKVFVKQEMVRYLTELDPIALNKIDSFATLDGGAAIEAGRYADYVIGKETIHKCTDDVFRGFWRRMWEVVEQSRNMPNPQV